MDSDCNKVDDLVGPLAPIARGASRYHDLRVATPGFGLELTLTSHKRIFIVRSAVF